MVRDTRGALAQRPSRARSDSLHRDGAQKRRHDSRHQRQDHRRYGLDVHGRSFDHGERLVCAGSLSDPKYSVDAFGVSTNKTTHGSLRGIGKADASYVIERLIDIAARELRLDPVEIRMKNFIPAEAFPYRNVTGALYDSGQYHLCLKRALEIAGSELLHNEQEELRRNGQYRGIGIALVMEPTSSSRIHATGGYASCRMRIDPSGAATVFSSMGEQGQGHETTIAQIVASQTGIPFEKIHVIHGDTLPTPYGFGTGSSRSSVVLMPSAWVAAKKMREKMLGIAARSLGVVPDKLDIANGKVSSKDDPGRSIEI